MNGAPSSTWFTASPHWGWLIMLYFFLGCLAGGSFCLAAMIDLFGRRTDRPIARLGYYIAFPCVVLCGVVLTLDLGRSLRFWHMLVESNTFRPMFKFWSPMSTGAWALLVFGLFSFLAFLTTLAEETALSKRWPALRRWHLPPPTDRLVAAIGAIFGLYLTGYTGVLLAVTNRPIWSDTPLLGMLFVVSAASTSAALIMLIAERRGWTLPGLADLHRFDNWVLALELVVLAAVMVSLGPVLQAWLNVWGFLLVAGVIIPGLLVPLMFSWRTRRVRQGRTATGALLVLLGGFMLRLIVVFSSQVV